jgi:A/G-specific adenine glycosylase
MIPKRKRQIIVHSLLRWYRRNGRNLPWRNTTNPYRILISEIMLQQTQVSRVLLKYPLFLKRFPTLARLARATRAEVIQAWQGMGYNNRAVRLHRLAREIVNRHDGRIPKKIDALMRLSGVGKYTAAAVACFAFGQPVPIVDVNIARVLRRLFAASREKDLWKIALTLLPEKHAYRWNQALMDLGATICTLSDPQCSQCPLASQCKSAFKVPPYKPEKRAEPGRNGIPNRIYRGRIVEALRQTNGNGGIPALTVARQIKPNFSRRDVKWFQSLLSGLQKDGLISVRNNRSGMILSLARR